MTGIEQLEYPLPVMKAEADKIIIHTSDNYEGSFWIKNTGGSELNGKITANLRGLTFSPQSFTGNKTEINVRFSADYYKKGDTLQTTALIRSNGGEITLPVTVHITAPALQNVDGEKLAALQDFLVYAKKNPAAAYRLFARETFAEWLQSINYEHMDIYAHFNQDANKERAMDDFLVFNNLKEKASLTVLARQISIRVKPFEHDPVTGVIPIRRDGWGYLAADIICAGAAKAAAPWLRLMTNQVTASDFDDNGVYEVSFIIYPNLMPQRVVSEKITVAHDTGADIYITVIKERELEVQLDRLSYRQEDTGKINVKNNTLKDLMLEVSPRDPFIKFEGKRYLIGTAADIPFTIKFTALQTAQHTLKKQPVIETEIHIRTYINDRRIDRVLPVSIGGV